MNFLSAVFKTFAPRVIGVAVAGAAGWLYSKSKGTVVLDPAGATQLITTMLLAYAAGHRASSSAINPGDAAKARVSDAIKDASDTGTAVRVAPDLR
jgi:hypothetical protein